MSELELHLAFKTNHLLDDLNCCRHEKLRSGFRMLFAVSKNRNF